MLSDVGNLRRYGTGDHFGLTMEIDLIFKIAAVGIIVSILNQVLSRSGREGCFDDSGSENCRTV